MHLVHRTQTSVRSVRRGAGLDGRGSRSKRKANWLGKERILKYRVRGVFQRDDAPGIEADDADALARRNEYYDPIYLLPESGQRWWRDQARAA